MLRLNRLSWLDDDKIVAPIAFQHALQQSRGAVNFLVPHVEPSGHGAGILAIRFQSTDVGQTNISEPVVITQHLCHKLFGLLTTVSVNDPVIVGEYRSSPVADVALCQKISSGHAG